MLLLFSSVAIAADPPNLQLPDGLKAAPHPLDQRFPQTPIRTLPIDIEDLPPLYERPLSNDEGPRIFIRRFHFINLPQQPEYGISPQEVIDLAERLRIEMQGLEGFTERGFTPQEKEVLDQFFEIVARDKGSALYINEYSTLMRELQERTQGRIGLTIGQIQEVADQLTNYFRARGHILALIVVPAQTIYGGQVNLQLLNGELNEILVRNQKLYDEDLLKLPFQDLYGRPVLKEEIENALLYLSDYPGLTVSALFEPGQTIGTTNLQLQVQEETSQRNSFLIDNYGYSTGEYRLWFNHSRYNLFGQSDNLDFSSFYSFEPSNSQYADLHYRQQLHSHKWHVGGRFAYSRYQTDTQEADLPVIEGYSMQGQLYLERQLLRSRIQNAYLHLAMQVKHSENEQIGNEDRLSILNMEFYMDHIDQRFRGINQIRLRHSHGFGDLWGSLHEEEDPRASRRSGIAPYNNAGGGFDNTMLSLVRLQNLAEGHSLLLRLNGQYSEDLLLPSEQYTIGGPKAVRGYGLIEQNLLYDKVLLFSAEWTMSNFKDILNNVQLSTFYDWAQGSLNEVPADREKLAISSVGGALSINIDNSLAANISIAFPVNVPAETTDQDPKLWLSANFSF